MLWSKEHMGGFVQDRVHNIGWGALGRDPQCDRPVLEQDCRAMGEVKEHGCWNDADVAHEERAAFDVDDVVDGLKGELAELELVDRHAASIAHIALASATVPG